MILVIGYGSLMSRFGIDERKSTNNLEIVKPFIVRFRGRRGFNTNRGRYMDIGKDFDPIGEIVNIYESIDKSGNSFECIAYYIKDEVLKRVAQREGYPSSIIERIKNELIHYNTNNDKFKTISEFLWNFYPYQEKNLNHKEKIQEYRIRLGRCINIDVLNSNSYIPHPVKLKMKNNPNCIYGLISIHTSIGAKKDSNNDIRLMNFNKAIHSGDLGRDTYFMECILGGVHGIDIRDLLSIMDIDDEKLEYYVNNLEMRINEEWKKTQDWEFHGSDLWKNLNRSGILEYFPNLIS